jgi:hypothetical protein
MTAHAAMEQSARRNEIVYLDDATADDMLTLTIESDDHAQHHDGLLEFWGSHDDGSAWRVHARLAEVTS